MLQSMFGEESAIKLQNHKACWKIFCLVGDVSYILRTQSLTCSPCHGFLVLSCCSSCHIGTPAFEPCSWVVEPPPGTYAVWFGPSIEGKEAEIFSYYP